MINAVGNRMTREIARQQKLADALERTQIQISGGKKLLRMSDDPVAARRIATIGTTQASMTAWSSNINAASALVSQADGVMKSVSDLMSRARELTIAATSDTANPADRATIAAELGTLAAIRDSNGDPVFAAAGARVMRFDSDVTFAPVPSAADVFVVGGNSLSTGIRDAAAAVAANDKAGMNASLDALATAISHVADEHAKIGLSGGRLDRIGDSLAVRGITLKDERSVVEDTDLSVAIAELNAQELTLSAAQAAFAKINRQTLFDILS